MKIAKKTAYIGVLSAVAILLGYLEGMIPLPVSVPGVKIGLSNICVMTALYTLGGLYALTVSLIKALVCGMLFWGAQGALFAVFGSIFSLGAMTLLKKYSSFSVVGVSAIGAVFHNLGQLLALFIFSGSFSFFYYISFLGLSALIMGTLTGIISKEVIKRLK